MTAPENLTIAEIPSATSGGAGGHSGRIGDLDIRLQRDISAIEDDWRRLESREWNSLNQSLDWCRTWCEAQGTSLSAVTGSIAGRIAFLLPIEIDRERFGNVARLPASRFNNLNTALFDADLAAPDAGDLRRLQTGLKTALRGTADLLLLDKVPLDWKGSPHPLAPLAAVEHQNHSFQLPLLGSMEETLAQVNAKSRRKKFRAQTRRLESAGGFDYLEGGEREEQHRLLELFFVQKAARFKAFGLPDVFAPAETRAFLHRLIDISSDRDHDRPLVLHALRLKGQHEGHIAAIAGLSRKGGHVLCQFGSIDDSLMRDASPGELLFWLCIENSIEAGATMFDLGIGDQPYKHSWCNRETVLHDLLVPITAKGSLLALEHVAATRIKAAVKRNPRLYALAQRWRARSGSNHD